jgi:hypothetical protein
LYAPGDVAVYSITDVIRSGRDIKNGQIDAGWGIRNQSEWLLLGDYYYIGTKLDPGGRVSKQKANGYQSWVRSQGTSPQSTYLFIYLPGN